MVCLPHRIPLAILSHVPNGTPCLPTIQNQGGGTYGIIPLSVSLCVWSFAHSTVLPMAQPDDSSRSNTPDSEDIDMEHDTAPSDARHQPVSQLQSPVSPQSVAGQPSSKPSGNSLSQRILPFVGGLLPSSKQGQQQQQQAGKKRTGHGKHQSASQGDEYGPGRAGGLMDPAQGSAYDRLLDLNYPRGA